MATIISIDYNALQAYRKQGFINPQRVNSSRRRLEYGMIQPAEEQVHIELANEHTAEPIKSLDDIDRISEYLINNGRYRDNMSSAAVSKINEVIAKFNDVAAVSTKMFDGASPDDMAKFIGGITKLKDMKEEDIAQAIVKAQNGAE